VNLTDLRALLEERSRDAPPAAFDHGRRMTSVRRLVRRRRRWQATCGAAVAVAVLLLGGYAVASYPATRHAQPVQPPPGPTPASASPVPGRSSPPAPVDTGKPRTRYTGPCTITAANTVIEGRTIACDLTVRATGVVVRRSWVTGTVHADSGSVTLEDADVDGHGTSPVVSGSNLTVVRSKIHGGVTSVLCTATCAVRDSYLNSFLASGTAGRTDAVLTHNTIACASEPGGPDAGCSGDVKLFADFGPLRYVTLDGNLFGASTGIAFCVFGGSTGGKPYPADHIVVVNNVFQRGTNRRCGSYGPVTDFDPTRPGNRWSGNTWDDGPAVPAG
jgi:hypothetical protein